MLVVGVWSTQLLFGNGGGPFQNGYFGLPDKTIHPVRREAVTPEFDETARVSFPGGVEEVKKVYSLRENHWYLSSKLTDFSQIIDIDRVFYVVNSANTQAYSTYRIEDDGRVELSGCATAYERDAELPIGFMGLTRAIIEQDVGGLPCDDYVITYSTRLHTVFVWVRSAEGDHIVTYPSRPEFVNLENHGVYTLVELKAALTEAYENDR